MKIIETKICEVKEISKEEADKVPPYDTLQWIYITRGWSTANSYQIYAAKICKICSMIKEYARLTLRNVG